MSPFKILLFVAITAACLSGIMFVFPEGGMSLSKDFTLNFPTWKSFWTSKEEIYTPLPDFILEADESSEEFLEEEEMEVEVEADTLIIVKSDTQLLAIKDTGKVKMDSILLAKKVAHPLEFPECEPFALFGFFESLDAASTKGGIHITHFGDSQLEGDRLSGYFRDRLQKQFGGAGPGLVSVIPAYRQASVKQEVTGNWQRYTLFGKNEQDPDHKRYGVMGAFSRFTPIVPDSAKVDGLPYVASCQLNTIKGMYKSARPYDNLTLYYGPVDSACTIIVMEGTDTLGKQTLKGKKALNKYTLKLSREAHDITIRFESQLGPDIYGINLDTPEGVTVDNVAMRGSSGTIYTRTDFEVLSGMLNEMNTTLAIMQFGGNSVPYLKDTAECVKFAEHFARQLKVMKRARPGMGIIVIGPSDMSFKDGDTYKTYPYLPVLVNEMRKATHEAGFVYWDMYEAMGGSQSMPTWVAADPPLAVQDYIHFSPRGARIVAELFYNALYESYAKYRAVTKKEDM